MIACDTSRGFSRSLIRELIERRSRELGIAITVTSDHEPTLEEVTTALYGTELETIVFDETPTLAAIADEARMLKPAPYYREHFEGRKKKGGRRKY